MIDFYLKATTEVLMDEALTEAGLLVDGEPTQGVHIDRIGLNPMKFSGADAEGEPIFEVQTGYHLNLRIIDEERFDLAGLEALSVFPETPMRVWA